MAQYKDSPKDPAVFNSAKEGRLYIGISGREKLSFVEKDFNSVEVTQTFEEIPTKRVFREWADSVDENFKFSVRLHGDITHKKRLKRAKGNTRDFLERYEALEEKTGPVLIQIDDDFTPKPWLLDEFLKGAEDIRIGLRYGQYIKFAFEPRNTEWYSHEIFEILKKHNTALVFSDIMDVEYSYDDLITADFIYVRLYGSNKEDTVEKYERDDLRKWADNIKKWRGEGRDVYVYFVNDHAPAAVEDLRSLLK